jgi:hypothetical protein
MSGDSIQSFQPHYISTSRVKLGACGNNHVVLVNGK